MFCLPRIAPVALSVLAMLCLAAACLAAAQTTEKRSSAPAKTTGSKTPATADAEQQVRVRRAQARSLLMALSTDARSFNDQTLRARSLARIADALWPVDAEQGRLLFRKAWEAAEGADVESDRKLQEEIQQLIICKRYGC